MSFAQQEQKLIKQQKHLEQQQAKIEQDCKMLMLDMKHNLTKFRDLLKKIKYSTKTNKQNLMHQSKTLYEEIREQIICLKDSQIENVDDQQYAMNYLKEYIQALRELREEQILIFNEAMGSQRGIQWQQEEQNQQILLPQSMLKKQYQQQNFMDEFIKQRDLEINQIQQKTNQIREIMKDLQETVVEQGSYINTLEDYILKSQQYTTQGKDELKKLDQKKKTSCRYLIIQSNLLYDRHSSICPYHNFICVLEL